MHGATIALGVTIDAVAKHGECNDGARRCARRARSRGAYGLQASAPYVSHVPSPYRATQCATHAIGPGAQTSAP